MGAREAAIDIPDFRGLRVPRPSPCPTRLPKRSEPHGCCPRTGKPAPFEKGFSRLSLDVYVEMCRVLACTAGGDMAAKCAAQLETSDRPRKMTRDRAQLPAEVLIRENHDRDHHNDLLSGFSVDACVARKSLAGGPDSGTGPNSRRAVGICRCRPDSAAESTSGWSGRRDFQPRSPGRLNCSGEANTCSPSTVQRLITRH